MTDDGGKSGESPHAALGRMAPARRVVGLGRRINRAGLRLVRAISTHQQRDEVLFVGYAEGALGLGQAFRSDVDAALRAHIPLSIFPIRAGIETRRTEVFHPDLYERYCAHPINIIGVATEELRTVRSVMGSSLAKGYNILRTYWELPRAPQIWRQRLGAIHEIWVPNQFVADAFTPIFSGPVHVVPPVVEVDFAPLMPRAALGLDEDRFYFLFSFDFHSWSARKNPMGVVAAFQAAFPQGDEPVGLLIKTSGTELMGQNVATALAEAAQRDSRIIIRSGYLGRNTFLSLMHHAGAYVSLHRAEGFGYGMAEAMMLERPVIATGYSGNQSFLNDKTGYPVAYTLRPLLPREYPHGEGQVWAEPDIACAAKAMQDVLANPEEALRRAAAGCQHIARQHSAEAVGKVMAERLAAIRANLPNNQ